MDPSLPRLLVTGTVLLVFVSLGEGQTMRADYGFAPRTVEPEAIGLAADEVYIAKFSSISEYKQGEHPYDEYVLKLAIQGLVNRDGPRLWLDFTEYGWPHGEQTWRTYYADTRGQRFRELTGGLDALVRMAAPAVNGIILYDMEPADRLFLALNLANLNACLPVSRRLYDAHREAFAGLPVVLGPEAMPESSEAIWDWLIENALPLTDRTRAHSAGATLGDRVIGGTWAHYIHGLDLPFRQRDFIFNLSPCPAPREHANYMVTGSAAESALFDRVMRALKPPAAVFGWCEPEEVFVERLAQFGHYLDNTAAGTNLSFHIGVPPLSPPPYTQDDTPRIDKPKRKCYLAFVSNEGDTTPALVHLFYRGWLSPGRGKVPINWAINPDLAARFPSLVEYLFRTRTPNDRFVFAPSGAGYTSPRNQAQLDAFLEHTARRLEVVRLREGELWYPEREALTRYAELIPGLRGLVIQAHGAQQEGALFSVGENALPVIRHRWACSYWMTKGDLCRVKDGAMRIDIEGFKAFLDGIYESGNLPRFVTFYGMQENLPEELAKLDAALDHSRFEIIDYGTLFHLAAQVHPPTLAPQTPAKAKCTWSPQLLGDAGAWDRSNDARVDAADGGLRVEVAQGKTWAVAVLRDVQIPQDATHLDVRVGQLSEGAHWVVKLSGDLDGFGLWDDDVPFGQSPYIGETTAGLSHRVRSALGRPLGGIQIGLAGPGGSSVVFEVLDFR